MVVQRPPAQKFEAQATSHFPQFAGSSWVGVSQPFDASPSHSAVPGMHGGSPQTPFQQESPSLQTLPQVPQAEVSVSEFLQVPSQHDQPLGQSSLATQLGVHVASVQVVPGAQLLSLWQLMQRPRSGSQVVPRQSTST